MIPSSHRLRVEEKKLLRKLVWTFISLIIGLIILIYMGLPLFAKIIVTLGSLRQDKTITSDISQTVLFPPVLDPIFEATNSSRITITGFGTEESTVKIFVNNEEKAKALVDKEGKFKASNIVLTEGNNTITAKTIKDDKESSLSSPLTISYIKNPPKLEIESPSDGQKFSSDNKEITIIGETDPVNKLIINERMVIVDQNGKFSYKVTLSDGENAFKIIATDQAGNKTEMDRKVTYNP